MSSFVAMVMEDPHAIPRGAIGEQEFYKTILLDSDWVYEPRRPERDDEEVDYVIHPPHELTNVLLWQGKTTHKLHHDHKTRRAHFFVAKKAENLFTSPRMWYFLAYFDEAIRTFLDPVFVVPSTYLHTTAKPTAHGRVRMEVWASMEAASDDQWARYRTSTRGIAQRINAIFASLPRETPSERLALTRFLERRRAA